jgi:hypothetical protein
VITIKLALAIIAFILSGGQIVFQTFQHHHAVTPRHGLVKFMIFIISSLSLIYLAKDIYKDFEDEKIATVVTASIDPQVELDYWHTIYRNPTPESYCSYLEKYPQGQFIAIAKKGIPNGDCLQVKQQAETESKAALEAELKAKLDSEAKALAEKNALLEKAAKDNAARIAALEQAKSATEPKAPPELNNAEAQLEAELKAWFESDANPPLETELPSIEQVTIQTDEEINDAKTAEDTPLF